MYVNFDLSYMCEIAYPWIAAVFSLYIRRPGQTDRWSHYVLTLSVRSSIRSFVSPNLSTRYLKINEQTLMSIDTSGRCGKDMKRSTLWSVA